MAPLDETADSDIEKVLQLNCVSNALLAKHGLKQLRRQRAAEAASGSGGSGGSATCPTLVFIDGAGADGMLTTYILKVFLIFFFNFFFVLVILRFMVFPRRVCPNFRAHCTKKIASTASMSSWRRQAWLRRACFSATRRRRRRAKPIARSARAVSSTRSPCPPPSRPSGLRRVCALSAITTNAYNRHLLLLLFLFYLFFYRIPFIFDF